jgi:hypothetical protein
MLRHAHAAQIRRGVDLGRMGACGRAEIFALPSDENRKKKAITAALFVTGFLGVRPRLSSDSRFAAYGMSGSSSLPGYTPNRGPAWPRILTVWLSCSILSGFFNTVTGLICKIRSRTSESG